MWRNPMSSVGQPLTAAVPLQAPSGGIRVSGQCLMIGQPFDGQAHGGGFVYEGDHRGGIIRTAGPGDGGSDLPPFTPDALMVTNHNMVRGCDEPYGGADGAVRAHHSLPLPKWRALTRRRRC